MKIIKVSFSKWKKGKLPDEGNGRDFQPSATMENLIRRRNSSLFQSLERFGPVGGRTPQQRDFCDSTCWSTIGDHGEFLNVGKIFIFQDWNSLHQRTQRTVEFPCYATFVIIHVGLWQTLVTLENLHCQIKTAQDNYSLFK